MSVPLLMAAGAMPEPPEGVAYDFTIAPTLPNGVSYQRSGAPQGYRDVSGNYVLAAADIPPWSYSGPTLLGLFYRQADRPLVNILEHDNYNPTDLAGLQQTNSLRVLGGASLNAGWSSFPFITSVHGIDGTSTSDNQNIEPSNPVGQGNPCTAVGFSTRVASATPGHRGILTDAVPEVLLDYTGAALNEAVFDTGSGTQKDSSSKMRLQSLSRATTLPQWVGACLYAGTLTLDDLDVAWGRAATLNGGSITVDIPDGTYNANDLELDHDGSTTPNTLSVVVSGGTYTLDLADFGLSTVEYISAFRTSGTVGPEPEPKTFDLRGPLPAGVTYNQPLAQIKRDASLNAFLDPVGGQLEDYNSGGSLGRIVETPHTNKLGFPNVNISGVDDSANLGGWSGVVPNGQVWNVTPELLGSQFGNTNPHAMTCIARRLTSSGVAGQETQTVTKTPNRAITSDNYAIQRLSSVTPQASNGQPLLEANDQGVYAALWTVIEDPFVPAYPIYDETGTSSAGGQEIVIQDAAYIDGAYDITIQYGSGVSFSLNNQNLSGDIRYVMDKSASPPGGIVLDAADFGAPLNERHVAQIQITPHVSNPPTPGPGPGPGGQLRVVRGLGSHHTWTAVSDPNTIQFNDLSNYEGLRTVSVKIAWKDIEPNEGQFNFDIIDQFENAIAAYGPNIRMIPLLVAQSWQASTGALDPRIIVPGWVCDPTPANFSRFGGHDYAGYCITGNKGYYAPRRWDQNFSEVWNRANAELMRYCSGRDRVAAVQGKESATGNITGAPGAEDFDRDANYQAFFDQVDLVAAAREGEQNFYVNLNWMTGFNRAEATAKLNQIYDRMVQLKCGAIVNDPMYPSGGVFTGGNYAVPGDEVIARNQLPALTLGEHAGAGNQYPSSRTSKNGSTWSDKTYFQYYSDSPGSPANTVHMDTFFLHYWFPSGNGTKATFHGWFENPSVDVSYWQDFLTVEDTFIDKP